MYAALALGLIRQYWVWRMQGVKRKERGGREQLVLEEVGEDEGCIEEARLLVMVPELGTGVGKMILEEAWGGGGGDEYQCFAFAASLDDLGVLLVLHEGGHVVHPPLRWLLRDDVICADLSGTSDCEATNRTHYCQHRQHQSQPLFVTNSLPMRTQH